MFQKDDLVRKVSRHEVVKSSFKIQRYCQRIGEKTMTDNLEKRIKKLEKDNERLFDIASGLTYDLFKAQEKLEHLKGNLDYFEGEIEQLFD